MFVSFVNMMVIYWFADIKVQYYRSILCTDNSNVIGVPY